MLKTYMWKFMGWLLLTSLVLGNATKIIAAEVSTLKPSNYTEFPRKALVIGNNAYPPFCEKVKIPHCERINLLRPLKNPRQDAIDIAKRLQSYGFQVTQVLDADAKTLRTVVDNFANNLKSDEVALVYYSGHGITNNCNKNSIVLRNFLIPLGLWMSHPVDICNDTKVDPVSTQWILDKLESRGPGTNILIFDACRSISSKNGKDITIRSNFSASLTPGSGSFIAYASASGQSANESPHGGRNSIYTRHLLEFLKPGKDHLPLPLLFQRLHKPVADSAWQETRNRQNPWENNGMIGDFCFRMPCLYHQPQEHGSSVKSSANNRTDEDCQNLGPASSISCISRQFKTIPHKPINCSSYPIKERSIQCLF